MEEKYTKVIAVGEEAINYLEDIKHNLQKNASFENIKVTKDVDKEFVRGLLDGIEVLYMLYDSSDKDVVNILKAISFMAQERRVLCIGLDICLKENKEDIGVDKEFKLNKYNLETTMDMINPVSYTHLHIYIKRYLQILYWYQVDKLLLQIYFII